MKKKKTTKSILEKLISKRAENILLVSKWSDADIDEMSKRYREAREVAYEENNFEAYKIIEEKLSQLYAAKDLKFSFTDEASYWIHW